MHVWKTNIYMCWHVSTDVAETKEEARENRWRERKLRVKMGFLLEILEKLNLLLLSRDAEIMELFSYSSTASMELKKGKFVSSESYIREI